MTTAVLIPGNMCDARLWTPRLRGVLADHGLPIVDADTTRDATIAGMAKRALAVVDGPVLPVGFSMGAIVALAMARIAPDRIPAMVVMGLNAGADLPERSAARIPQQAEVRAGGLDRVLVEELKPNYLAAANRGDGALLTLLRDMGLTLGPDVFVAQSEALRTRDDHRDVLDTFAGAVLLACGAEDALCPPEWHRRWAGRLADPDLNIIETAGHMLPLEADDRLSMLLADWLERKDL